MHWCVVQNWASPAWDVEPGPSTGCAGGGAVVDGGGGAVVVVDVTVTVVDGGAGVDLVGRFGVVGRFGFGFAW